MSHTCDYDITPDHSANTECGKPAETFFVIQWLASKKIAFVARCRNHSDYPKPTNGLEDKLVTMMTEDEFEVARVHES
jgi:hypothetical protein